MRPRAISSTTRRPENIGRFECPAGLVSFYPRGCALTRTRSSNILGSALKSDFAGPVTAAVTTVFIRNFVFLKSVRFISAFLSGRASFACACEAKHLIVSAQ
jgi:hypothetical protein